MRAYTVATTAVTLGIPAKWMDNVLSHFSIAGVRQSHQGIARTLTPRAILTLAASLRLSRELGMPLHLALDMADRLVEAGGSEAQLTTQGGVTIVVDIAALAQDVESRLAHAVEVAPTPKRGRPPK